MACQKILYFAVLYYYQIELKIPKLPNNQFGVVKCHESSEMIFPVQKPNQSTTI